MHVGITDDEVRKKIASKLNISQKKKAPKEAEDVHETTVWSVAVSFPLQTSRLVHFYALLCMCMWLGFCVFLFWSKFAWLII